MLSVMSGRLDDKEIVVGAEDGAQPKSAEHVLSELGLTVSPATPDVLQRFDLAEGVDSLVITDVDANSAAYEEGIRAGDLLTEVNQKKVTSPKEAEKLVKEAKKDGKRSVLLLIEGQSGFRFVAVKLR